MQQEGEVRDGVVSGARVVENPLDRRFVILVANAKGGCGKTTLATNLASHFAVRNRQVTLLDLDPQQSATHWLRLREKTDAAPIQGLQLSLEGSVSKGQIQAMIQRSGEYLIIDTPAGLSGATLDHVLSLCHVVLVPVLPSPIDIRATTRFLQAVMLTPSYRRRPRRLAVLANRAKARTRVYHQLQQFLRSLKIPWLTTLRDTQYYVQASGEGTGLTELDSPRVRKDLQEWQRVMEWLEIQRALIRSMPGFR